MLLFGISAVPAGDTSSTYARSFAGSKVRLSSGRQCKRPSHIANPLRTRAAIQREHVNLPERGISLEVLSPAAGSGASSRSCPPLILLHGSLHAAWAWEPLLEKLASVGIVDTYAVSLRGYTSDPAPQPGAKIRVSQHMDDLEAYLKVLNGPPPIIVGHSMGGYIAQRLVTRLNGHGIAGMVLLASTPPSGNSALVMRTIFRLGLPFSWRITMGFVRNGVAKDVSLCRDMFFTRKGQHFDKQIEDDHALSKYCQNFALASSTRLQTKDITPIPTSTPSLAGKVLVLGGEDDVIVDVSALQETAEFWKGDLVVLPNTPHDLILASTRDLVASKLAQWLENFCTAHC